MAQDDQKKSYKLAGQVAVSTSLALIATSAMAETAHDQQVDLTGDDTVSADVDQAIAAAVGKRSVRDAVSASFWVFANRVSRDGHTVANDYFGDTPMESFQVAVDDDSTDVSGMGGPNTNQTGGFSCYSNCHGACHGACHGNCHGSRGWR